MTTELTEDEWREATTYDLIDWHRTFSTEGERDAAWCRFLARVRRDAAARTAVPHLLDQLDQQERELDSWMTRAYEAEGKLWKAEARIRHLEDTAQVLVKEALKAEAERDAARGYISELETAVESRNDVIKHRDARIKAVRDVLADYAPDEDVSSPVPATPIRRALDG